MRFIRGLKNIKKCDQKAVVTIGNFDAVHLGHQAILKRVKYVALDEITTSLVVLFEPQPQEYFSKDPFYRLSGLRDKVIEFIDYGIDGVLVIPFNQAFAELSAEDFVKRILVDALDVRHVVVGDDFRFGAERKGDYQYLNEMAKKYGFKAEECSTVQVDRRRVSSTYVRECLQLNDLEKAEELLGHPYRLAGRVVPGDKIGHTIGYPTANINVRQNCLLLRGVYAVRVEGLSPHGVLGVATIGVRPTLNPGKPLLEVYLLDFNQNIYGCRVRVEFLKKLRDEEKFNSADALKEQIAKDVEMARKFLAR